MSGMKYSDYFINTKKPLLRPRPVVVEEDFELVCSVFPEPGFRTFFYGHIISKLAADLRKHGITNYTERESRPDFPTFTGFLSNIVLIGDSLESDDGRGAGVPYKDGTSSSGKSADNAGKAPVGKQTDSEGRKKA